MFTLCIYIIVVFIVIFYSCFSYLIKVQIGKPPINELVIAYKYYNLHRKVSFSTFKDHIFNSPNYKQVKLCYCGPKAEHIEFAQGVILNEVGKCIDASIIPDITKWNLNLFCTPIISHAIFIVVPIINWCPLTKVFAILFGYPKLYRFAERYNLCAYPVIEIYSASSVTMILPLMRQDDFVVSEAEDFVFGLSYPANLRPFRRIYISRKSSIEKSFDNKWSYKRDTKG